MRRSPDGPGYTAGSHTSKAAAESIEPKLGKLQRQVLLFIRMRGAHGATDPEIAGALGLARDTARPRRRELGHKGLVGDSGRTRKTPSGRQAVVWVDATRFPVTGAPRKEACPTCGALRTVRSGEREND